MLKLTQETLNLGFMRRIMLSVLVWAIGVIYHVDVYAAWHTGWVDANCFDTTKSENSVYIDDSGYIFRSGKNENTGANCCGVDYGATFYYAPIKVLNNMVWVYNKSEGWMSTLMALAGEKEDADTSKVVCMDETTHSSMIKFFAQSCQESCLPHQPNVCSTTWCESNKGLDEGVYGTSIATGQPALTTSNVHVPTGDSKWRNRRRFQCWDADVSDFYGGEFTTGAYYLTGYAYPVLLVGGGFSSAYENLYTGDCKSKSSHAYRLNPSKPCWNTETDSGPLAGPNYGCLQTCPKGYYCPQDTPLGDFFFDSRVSRTEVINGVLTSFYENGRRPYGGALQCKPGSYNSTAGSRSCKPCADGTYQSLYAQSSCNTCPSTSQYDTSGNVMDSITGTTSAGAKSETDCYLVSNGNLLAGGIGLFTFTGECYYS